LRLSPASIQDELIGDSLSSPSTKVGAAIEQAAKNFRADERNEH
jgi:hypothetical protein